MAIAQEIQTFIRSQPAAVKISSQAHAAYTGSSHNHYGLSLPTMRARIRTLLQVHTPDEQAWLQALDILYAGESIEEKIFAGLLLARFRKYRAGLDLTRLDRWLYELEGWAEVDSTCQSTFGADEMLARWQAWEPFLRGLAADTKLARQRASLVLLVMPVRKSPDMRLWTCALANIDQLKFEKDKLVSKAVSWLLREGIRHHRQAVEACIEDNAALMPAFVVRQVRAKLNSRLKNPGSET